MKHCLLWLLISVKIAHTLLVFKTPNDTISLPSFNALPWAQQGSSDTTVTVRIFSLYDKFGEYNPCDEATFKQNVFQFNGTWIGYLDIEKINSLCSMLRCAAASGLHKLLLTWSSEARSWRINHKLLRSHRYLYHSSTRSGCN